LEFFGEEIALMSKNLRPLAEIRGTKSSPIQKFNLFFFARNGLRNKKISKSMKWSSNLMKTNREEFGA
jgi:hypothetical protein